MLVTQNKYFDRELSWLSFNHRVLQEAEETSNPLMERIKFLAIYSSNMDEFFKVRVASLRSLRKLTKDTRKELLFNPKKILRKIHDETMRQQMLFGEIFRNDIVPELRKLNIFLTRSEELSPSQHQKVLDYFVKDVRPFTNPTLFDDNSPLPFLKDGRLYLAVRLRPLQADMNIYDTFALCSIPTHKVPRFFSFQEDEKHYVLFLGDVVRLGVKNLFPNHEVLGAYSVKMSRDAELHIEDEFEGDLVEKIKESLNQRTTGVPMRFLFDVRLPEDMLQYFRTRYKLTKMDMIRGGRYHSLNDFFSFPNPNDIIPQFPPIQPISHPRLEKKKITQAIQKGDVLLHFPYQSFDYIIRWLEEAAEDKAVTEIKVTLYRVSADSKVVQALIKAAEKGIAVTAFVELKARFDEASNLTWASKMEEAGIRVLYSMPGLKVHTKLCCVTRKERGKEVHYTYLASGNFNEKTAKIYCDIALLTKDAKLGEEATQVFALLETENLVQGFHFDELLVAPNFMQTKFFELMDYEIYQARRGNPAYIQAKMNSLEEWGMIDKLYEASRAGVKIDLIVRGICCLKTGVKGMSENIRVVSIVGRYLEHARIFRFCHGGEDKVYISSADWMRRNLNKRVEIAFPVKDAQCKSEVIQMMEMQIADNVNARLVNYYQDNVMVRAKFGQKRIDSQMGMYEMLKHSK
ncbi:MAG: polyphosphate kinase 1 [Bacteroidia bacterium]